MNLLLDSLPEEIGGTPINTDFRAMVLLELMLADSNVPNDSKVPLAIDYLYREPVPDLQKAVDGLLWYYRCGEPEPVATASASGGKQKRAYDFEQDAPYIYAAFLSTYSIDLNSVEQLHWWKFHAMFMALPEQTQIVKIMGYRTADISKLKGEEKKFYRRMQNIYRIRAEMNVEHLSLAAQEQSIKEKTAARFAEAEKWAQSRKEDVGH